MDSVFGSVKAGSATTEMFIPMCGPPPPPLSQSQINTPTLTQTDSPRRTLTPPPPKSASLIHSLMAKLNLEILQVHERVLMDAHHV